MTDSLQQCITKKRKILDYVWLILLNYLTSRRNKIIYVNWIIRNRKEGKKKSHDGRDGKVVVIFVTFPGGCPQWPWWWYNTTCLLVTEASVPPLCVCNSGFLCSIMKKMRMKNVQIIIIILEKFLIFWE